MRLLSIIGTKLRLATYQLHTLLGAWLDKALKNQPIRTAAEQGLAEAQFKLDTIPEHFEAEVLPNE